MIHNAPLTLLFLTLFAFTPVTTSWANAKATALNLNASTTSSPSSPESGLAVTDYACQEALSIPFSELKDGQHLSQDMVFVKKINGRWGGSRFLYKDKSVASSQSSRRDARNMRIVFGPKGADFFGFEDRGRDLYTFPVETELNGAIA
ncbi:MAG: hypothetical protein AB7N80_12950, partial [Bdellovibrionales bacterium]